MMLVACALRSAKPAVLNAPNTERIIANGAPKLVASVPKNVGEWFIRSGITKWGRSAKEATLQQSPEPIEAWCRQAPFGQYARRTGSLYEWLTGQHLGVPDVTNGGYVDAISMRQYLTRTAPLRVRRWRINDNLPGVPGFCPMVRRAKDVQEALQFDVDAAPRKLNRTFGADILMRKAFESTTRGAESLARAALRQTSR